MDDVNTGSRWRAPGRARLWAKQPGKVNQRRHLKTGRKGPKLPLFGTHDTSLPMNDRDRKPKFRRGGGKDPARGRESGRRPPWRGREASSEGPAILYGWHTVVAALANTERHIRKLMLTENAARRLAEGNIATRGTPDIVPPGPIASRPLPEATGGLAKSASGALELVPLVTVQNLARALTELNDQGFMTVGLDSQGSENLGAMTLRQPLALVLGAEGKGLRQLTRETCTAVARLDMPGEIKSLNVSNAAVLALYIGASRLGLMS